MIKTKGCKVNKYELDLGIPIEMEHTNSKKVAERIAKQHLCEFKGKPYYTELIKMEARLKHEKK